MIKGLKGAIIAISSMIGISVLALLHYYEIINLSVWVSLPLIIASMIVTLLGLMHMLYEFAESEEKE